MIYTIRIESVALASYRQDTFLKNAQSPFTPVQTKKNLWPLTLNQAWHRDGEQVYCTCGN